ncbi:MAG: molecular chaperone DnaJ [Acidimicrobiales bacterium]
MASDYYALLGVGRDATADDIKRAYRRLARELHPDANPGDPDTEALFKEVARAYEVLSDPDRRRRYDAFGPDGVGATVGGGAGDPFGFGGGLGDIFDAFFGGGRGGSVFTGGMGGPATAPRGTDLEVVAELSFETAVFGGEHELTVRTAVACETCEATGAAPGSRPTTCPDCGGTGQVRRVRQSILGQMVTAGRCGRCSGFGRVIERPCADCRGEGRRIADRVYTVDIPPGVETGSTLRLTGRGAAGVRGGGYGDLYVHVKVLPHPRFARDGDDLVADVHIPVTQAALGTAVEFETLDGVEDLVIPRGTQSGRVFRLRGRGVPRLGGRGRGDLHVRVVVDVPDDLSPEEEGLLRQLAELRGDEVAPPEGKGFFSRVKSAFT